MTIRTAMLGLAALSLAATAWAAKLTVHNVSSNYDIHHLYVSHYTDRNWGPDQLGDDIVEPGETFTLTGIQPGTYDIKIVDDESNECIIEDVDFVRNPVFAFDGSECAAASN
jgi:hypothetical protein